MKTVHCLTVGSGILAATIADMLQKRSNTEATLDISYENGFVELKLGDLEYRIQGQGRWVSKVCVPASILGFLDPEKIKTDPWPNEIRVVGNSIRIWRAQLELRST